MGSKSLRSKVEVAPQNWQSSYSDYRAGKRKRKEPPLNRQEKEGKEDGDGYMRENGWVYGWIPRYIDE